MLGLPPWESRRLTPSELEQIEEGKLLQWDAAARLAQWMLRIMPIAVSYGISVSFGGKPDNWTYADLLDTAPFLKKPEGSSNG